MQNTLYGKLCPIFTALEVVNRQDLFVETVSRDEIQEVLDTERRRMLNDFYSKDPIAKDVSIGNLDYEEEILSLIEEPLPFLERPAGPIQYHGHDQGIEDLICSLNSVGVRNIPVDRYTSSRRRTISMESQERSLVKGTFVGLLGTLGPLAFSQAFFPELEMKEYLQNLCSYVGISSVGFLGTMVYGDYSLRKEFEVDRGDLINAASLTRDFLRRENVRYQE